MLEEATEWNQRQLDILYALLDRELSILVHSLSSDRCQWHCAREEGDEPSSLAAESEPLLGPHLEDYWSHGGLLGPLWRTIG